MPRMNGFEVCRKIREDDGMKSVPIIMVTTRGEGENVENGFQSGCSDYITKPFSSLELLTKIESYLAEEQAMKPAGGNRPSPTSRRSATTRVGTSRRCSRRTGSCAC